MEGIRQTRKGYILITLTSFLFGMNTLGLRYYFTNYPHQLPENAAFWGILGAVTLFFPVYLFSGSARMRMLRSIKRDGRVILVVALMSSLGAFLWISALKEMAAGPVSLLAKSQVIYSTILGIVLLRERFTFWEIVGIIVSLTGVVVVSRLGGEASAAAVMLALASAFIYSAQSLIVKKFAPELDGFEFTYLRASLMVLFFLIFFSLKGSLGRIALNQFLFLGFTSVSGLLLGRTFYYESHKYLDISRLSIGMLLEPVFVLVTAVLLLGEIPGIQKITGAVLIIAGLWMTSLRKLF